MTTTTQVGHGLATEFSLGKFNHAGLEKITKAFLDDLQEEGDSPTSNLLQDILDKIERRKWFLYEVMQGSKNTE
jgi:hypothetical protein